MDAACSLEKGENTGQKFSTAYAPPEAVAVTDEVLADGSTCKIIKIKSHDCISPLKADKSFGLLVVFCIKCVIPWFKHYGL